MVRQDASQKGEDRHTSLLPAFLERNPNLSGKAWLKTLGVSIGISGAIFFSVPFDRQPPEFGTAYVKMEMDEITPSWRGTLARYERQKAEDFAGFSHQSARYWEEAQRLAERPASLDMLKALNGHLNRVVYRDDSLQRDIPNEWATPLEFIEHGGDCEDYVTAKFLALAAAGWPSKNMRLVIGELADGSHHAVLVVRLHGYDTTWHVLDNRSDRIRTVAETGDFIPFFGMSQRATWIYKRNWGTRVADGRLLPAREAPAVCAEGKETAAPGNRSIPAEPVTDGTC
jgi:predicted transglutaminase-like cysteine proteinase